jgi:squalene-hopene/tetraprenyl-beta-curcumene cyclase
VRFLIERQHDGTWDEPEYTGTGFPGDFYINYHLYRHVFPTAALAASEAAGLLGAAGARDTQLAAAG